MRSTKSENTQDADSLRSATSFRTPSWTVPAAREVQLEHIADEKGRQKSFHLNTDAVYYIGRSLSKNQIHLTHDTSSRRHAMIFHHPCGTSYLVDLHSAHGTVVDGEKIAPNIPIQVKRGSTIRFGCDGADTFILRKTSTKLCTMVHKLGGIAESLQRTSPSSPDMYKLEREVKQKGSACIKGEDGVSCIIVEEDVPDASLALLSMRLRPCEESPATGRKRKCIEQKQSTKYETAKKDSPELSLSRKKSRDHLTAEKPMGDYPGVQTGPPGDCFTNGIKEKKIVFVMKAGSGLSPFSYSHQIRM